MNNNENTNKIEENVQPNKGKKLSLKKLTDEDMKNIAGGRLSPTLNYFN